MALAVPNHSWICQILVPPSRPAECPQQHPKPHQLTSISGTHIEPSTMWNPTPRPQLTPPFEAFRSAWTSNRGECSTMQAKAAVLALQPMPTTEEVHIQNAIHPFANRATCASGIAILASNNITTAWRVPPEPKQPTNLVEPPPPLQLPYVMVPNRLRNTCNSSCPRKSNTRTSAKPHSRNSIPVVRIPYPLV